MNTISTFLKWKKPISILWLVSILTVSFGSNSYAGIIIPAGTPVITELDQVVDSEGGYHKTAVRFRVKYNVVVNGIVVVSAGTFAEGHIVHLRKKKGLGKPGFVEVKVDKILAVDGTPVVLSSSPLCAEGENREGLAIGLGVGMTCVIGPFGLFFLCLKGGAATLHPGTELVATVLYDTEISLKQLSN